MVHLHEGLELRTTKREKAYAPGWQIWTHDHFSDKKVLKLYLISPDISTNDKGRKDRTYAIPNFEEISCFLHLTSNLNKECEISQINNFRIRCQFGFIHLLYHSQSLFSHLNYRRYPCTKFISYLDSSIEADTIATSEHRDRSVGNIDTETTSMLADFSIDTLTRSKNFSTQKLVTSERLQNENERRVTIKTFFLELNFFKLNFFKLRRRWRRRQQF